jgi:hypothetical protein
MNSPKSPSSNSSTNITNLLVVPVLTGIADGIAMYGYFKGKGGQTSLLGMPMSDVTYCGLISGTGSLGAEFFGDVILPKLQTGTLSADTIKMLYEPSVVGLSNYAATKATENFNNSGFVAPFAIGAGSNVAAAYAAKTITSSYK